LAIKQWAETSLQMVREMVFQMAAANTAKAQEPKHVNVGSKQQFRVG